jgi:hypothetical protein
MGQARLEEGAGMVNAIELQDVRKEYPKRQRGMWAVHRRQE